MRGVRRTFHMRRAVVLLVPTVKRDAVTLQQGRRQIERQKHRAWIRTNAHAAREIPVVAVDAGAVGSTPPPARFLALRHLMNHSILDSRSSTSNCSIWYFRSQRLRLDVQAPREYT